MSTEADLLGRTDVCVIGGGIIGLAVAFELCSRGRAVTVLEASRVGEQAAAGVAAGMLAPVSEADISHPALTTLALASHQSYARWVARIEAASGMAVGYDRSGTLFVALHRDHVAEIEHLRAFQHDRGLEAEWVGREELRELEPALAPAAQQALWLPHDHQVDPRRLLAALASAVRGAGGALVEQARAGSVERAGGQYRVRYGQGGEQQCLSAGQVVLAAGAWSGELRGDVPDLPLRPVKGQILRLRGDRLVRHVVRTPDVYLVPRADGELVVGATMEEQGFDARSTAGASLDLLLAAWRVLPGFYELELAERSVGFRPALRDHLPAIGAADGDGLFAAVGHFRNGVELAPVTARLLADLMCDGRLDPLLDAFAPGRFAASEAVATAAR